MMVNPDIYAYATGAILAISYMVMGIGVSRIVSKAYQRVDIRMFEVFFWPIALCVLAVSGNIRYDDD